MSDIVFSIIGNSSALLGPTKKIVKDKLVFVVGLNVRAE